MTRPDALARLLEGVGSPRILCVGDLMLDQYVFGSVERISPEAPIPVLRVGREEWRPGGVGSVVSMLRRLGAEVDLVSAVGTDETADRVIADLEALGVPTDGVARVEGRPTIRKTRLIANVQHVLRVDREVTTAYPAAVDALLCERVAERMAAADIVLVSDYGKGLLRGGVLPRLAALRGPLGREVLLDPKKQPDYSPYRGVTAITPNRAETELSTGIAPRDPETWRAAAAHLCAALGIDHVVLTLDREGIFYYAADGASSHIPTEPRAVYDVTGAGDMVLSVLGLCRAAGIGWREAAELANAAAGVEITRVGVAPLGRDEIVAGLTGRADPVARKVIPLERFVAGPLAELRRKGKRIVYTNGCFDILHVGHVKLLQFARAQGDHLVVGLNSDASVQRLKGQGRPILAEQERANLLAALEAVDHVLLFEGDTPMDQIEAILPDVLVKAADYENRTVVGRAVVEENGGQVVLAPLVGGVSTTRILERLRGAEPDGGAADAARAAAEAAYAAVEQAAGRSRTEEA